MAEKDDKVLAPQTLSDFIGQESKLITAIGLFVALTAVSGRIDDPSTQLLLPGLALLAALVITLELFLKFPPVPERHWRLTLFELALLGILVVVGKYWFLKFPMIWGPAVSILTFAVLGLLYFAFFMFFFHRLWLFIARRCHLRPKALQAIWTGGQLTCAVLGVLGFHWTVRGLPAAIERIKALFR